MTCCGLPELVACCDRAAHASRWQLRAIAGLIAVAAWLTALGNCFSVYAGEATLAVLPSTSTLTGAHAVQQLVAESIVDTHFAGDRTEKAKFASSDEHVATVDKAGIVHPIGNGEAKITATIDGQSAMSAITVAGMDHDPGRSFRNDVQPVLAKMGCSMGACHGALAGKGGFKLSLRGYDALADYAAITRADLVDAHRFANSLLS